MKIQRLMAAVFAAPLGVLASAAHAKIKTEWVEYSHGDAKLKGYLVDASKVALIGYCMGGAVGVELAYTGAPLVGTVAIHGSFLHRPPGQAKAVKGKMLILHGAEDVPIPIPMVNALIEELRAAKVDFRYELYSGAGHGFSVPKNKADERANIQSMASTAWFLKEVFGAEDAVW